LWAQGDIDRCPEKYTVGSLPYPGPMHDWFDRLVELLSPLEGRRILELGSGLGKVSVWFANRGAHVTGVDVGPELVEAARRVAELNHANCEFFQADITAGLPVEPNTIDAVIGLALLHHLSAEDIQRALKACSSVLKPDGIAVFLEPVENSKLFSHFQNLVPVGKKYRGSARPSILQRTAWKAYVGSLDDRDLTNSELISAGEHYFRTIRICPFGFFVRLEGFVGYSFRSPLQMLDRFLFRVLPPIQRYCQTVLVEYRK
jgi:ubiquinone/menaquinone biosynthesis C-methylase UbiE